MSKIIFNPEIFGGKPIIKGTRISVDFILELLSSGMSVNEILKEYNHLKREDILEALDYAAKSIKREEIILSSFSRKKRMRAQYGIKISYR